MLVVVSLQWNGIFYPHNLLFSDLDFSHSSYIMLHGATAKWRFLVFFVFSLQRGAPFLMYGMVDSSFINNELCVCLNVFSAEYGIWEHSKNPQLKEADTDASFLSWRVNSLEQPRAVFVQDQEVFWVHVPRQDSLCSGRNIGSVSRIAREDL